jgi:tRNA pseudouridine65 synthase/23S rRNA pseudouridine1911/1915/1917 synthase
MPEKELIKKILISKEYRQIRLIKFAQTHFIDIIQSNKGEKKAIKRGAIRVNGRVVNDGYFLKENDEVQLFSIKNTKQRIFKLDIDIVYEDEYLAVINKPAGYVVNGNLFKTIENALPGILTKTTVSDALDFPKPVHRLDKATTGLLLIAKSKRTQILLGNAFESNNIEKYYKAILIGKFPKKLVVDKEINEKEAQTIFTAKKLIKSKNYGYLSLVEINIKNGRKHQIRIHSAKSGFPVLGDNKYSHKFLDKTGKGLFLCACKIKFYHPITNNLLQFELPLPNKFKTILKYESI